ncbi:kelch repeat and BTB domain-containing protein 8-like isoform X2 [Dysidea avara]|uniref:kelch repeat and BTB domain-containing protein 8-like isoform X2 n=1 Tax=Dysidea avara TaxID=196820 RepID=UPI003319C3E8
MEAVNSIKLERDVRNVLDMQDNAEVLEEPSWCCEMLSCLLQDPSTQDVVFVTSDGGSVSGHKAILTASSPVFRAMFNDNVHTSGEMEISLPSVDAETFSSLVSYIYTGKVVVNSATCLDMLGTAMHFKITSLVTKLVKFTTVSLDSSNVISVAIFACAKNCCQLLDNCLKYMCANASEVVHHSGFIKLPHEVVLAFCKSSDLNVSEIDLFLAVNEWQQYNQKVAKAIIKNIFREIRYPLISNTDLVRKVAPTDMADPSLYTAALEYHIDASLYRGPLSQLVTRKCHKVTSLNSSKIEPAAVLQSTRGYSVLPSNLVDAENKSSIKKLYLVVKSVSSVSSDTTDLDSSVSHSKADGEPAPNDSETRSVATSKLDKVVEAIYSQIDDGMVPSDITSPDTIICVLSDDHFDSTIQPTTQRTHCIVATTSAPRRKKRRRRCNNCEGCKADKCGVCVCCTQPRRKTPCIKRICSNLQ